MIKWRHLYIAVAKDQAQRHGYLHLDCPPQLPFLYAGWIVGHGRRDLGSFFFRVRTPFDLIPQVKTAHIRASAFDDTWGDAKLRIRGSTTPNQPQITSRHAFDSMPKTKAYVDYTAYSWDKDKAYTIDVTPILREQHQLGLLTPDTYVGFKVENINFRGEPPVIIYALDGGVTDELTVHISCFVDLPGDSDPPPDPEIPQPPNNPLLPPVFTPPEVPLDRAMVLAEGIYWGNNQAHVVATTDESCLMKLLWTDVAPEEHAMTVLRRGRVYRWDKKYCFVSWHEIPEENPLPSGYHDFCWPDWQDGDTKYYRYVFIFNSEQIKPNTPFHWATYPGDSAWIIPEDPTITVLLPGSLTEEGLPCFGPELVLYDPFSWGGIEPPDFDLFYTEIYTWLPWPPVTWTLFFTEPWG